MPTTEIHEQRLIDPNTNTSKYYQIYTVRDVVLENRHQDVVAYHWGRIGSKGQWKLEAVPAGSGSHVAGLKGDEKAKKGYGFHSQDLLDIVPDEIQSLLATQRGQFVAQSASMDLTTLLGRAQKMTVDLMEGTVGAGEVALLLEQARDAQSLQQQLQGRLEVLQMLVMQEA